MVPSLSLIQATLVRTGVKWRYKGQRCVRIDLRFYKYHLVRGHSILSGRTVMEGRHNTGASKFCQGSVQIQIIDYI